MSEEPLDTRMEALFRAAQGREDVYRFQQVLREVASEVEARNDDKESRVIPINRDRWKWWAAAASVAVLLGVGGLIMRFSGNADRMALAQVEGYTWQVRGDGTADAFNTAMTQARELVLEGKPGDAVAFLANLEATGCPEAERRWLLGAARILSGDHTSAKGDLEFAQQAGCAISPKAKALLAEL